MPPTISSDERSTIGVLDAQDEDAAVPPREEPVEQRRARAADVEIAGGRGCEADSDSQGLDGFPPL